MNENTITPRGERIRSIRKRRGMSQKELARAAGVSLAWVKTQEQGNGGTPTTETLHKVAVALRVPTTKLIASVQPGAPHPQTAQEWLDVRSALHYDSEAGRGATTAGVLEALAGIRPALAANRYSGIRVLLPGLIRDAASLPPGDEEGARSRVLNLTAWLLTQTRQWEDAETAARLSAATAGEDRLLAAAAVNTSAWSLLRQGRLAEARDLATAEADAMEPRFSRTTPRELALWGRLLLGVTNAAVRDNRAGEAAEALSLASAAAERIGREITADGSTTRTFGPATVRMIAAENASIAGHPDQVLRISEEIPPRALHPLSASRCRHRLDVANACVMLHDYGKALDILQELRAGVPEWLVQQGYARIVMRSIVRQRRTLTRTMRDLADAINMPL